MTDVNTLCEKMKTRFAEQLISASVAFDELTIQLPRQHLHDICLILRDDPEFQFNMLLDVCGVDYLQYGHTEWETESTTATGFERGVDRHLFDQRNPVNDPRFATVYHLLSLPLNHRVRLRVPLDEHELMVDSVCDIWMSANWFEREAFDLFGITFNNHPDLRRILTDYGFVGHPFRKDFPLIGKVEARYDAAMKRVIYEPVSIQPRVLEPKVIRDDNRYTKG